MVRSATIKILMSSRLSPRYCWRFARKGADCSLRATCSRSAVSQGRVPPSPGDSPVSRPVSPLQSLPTHAGTGGLYQQDPLVCALLQKLQPGGCLAPSGINQSPCTSRFSRNLRISILTSPTYFKSAGGEHPTAGIPLPSPHCPVGSISPLSESSSISNF